MQKESEEVVRALRATVAEERRILDGLGNAFTHPSMKEWVKRALWDLDDVEMLFLSFLDKEPRTAAQEASWIRSAYVPLEWATARRRRLEDAMKAYGADARLVPWP